MTGFCSRYFFKSSVYVCCGGGRGERKGDVKL